MISSWYILHVHSGAEDTVKQKILENSIGKSIKEASLADASEKKGNLNLAQAFKDVIVPCIGDNSDAKKSVPNKKVMPGYILVNMVMCEQSYLYVTGLPKVIGFLDKKKPRPIPQKQVDQLVSMLQDKAIEQQDFELDVGDKVKILDGPFTSMHGNITSIDTENKMVDVSVSIFGSPTSINLTISSVKKLD